MGTLTIIILCLALFAFYWLPFIIAYKREHEYVWIIFAINLALAWTGLFWAGALIWALYPNNKTLLDPAVGSVTGKGYRNAGDTIGEAQYGRARGLDEELKKDQVRKGLPVEITPEPKTITIDKIEVLERLQKLRDAGTISDEQFEKEKNKIFL